MGFLSIGIKMLPYIVTCVDSVERFIKGPGGQKEDAAVAMVPSILQTVEVGTDKDLLNDAEVNTATRKVMQAVVALQNVIKSKNG